MNTSARANTGLKRHLGDGGHAAVDFVLGLGVRKCRHAGRQHLWSQDFERRRHRFVRRLFHIGPDQVCAGFAVGPAPQCHRCVAGPGELDVRDFFAGRGGVGVWRGPGQAAAAFAPEFGRSQLSPCRPRRRFRIRLRRRRRPKLVVASSTNDGKLWIAHAPVACAGVAYSADAASTSRAARIAAPGTSAFLRPSCPKAATCVKPLNALITDPLGQRANTLVARVPGSILLPRCPPCVAIVTSSCRLRDVSRLRHDAIASSVPRAPSRRAATLSSARVSPGLHSAHLRAATASRGGA